MHNVVPMTSRLWRKTYPTLSRIVVSERLPPSSLVSMGRGPAEDILPLMALFVLLQVLLVVLKY